MIVYILTADVYGEGWGAQIVLFGVFSSREEAEARAKDLKLDCCRISKCKIDEDTNQYLGGYIE